jgi:hypothetical protein
VAIAVGLVLAVGAVLVAGRRGSAVENVAPVHGDSLSDGISATLDLSPDANGAPMAHVAGDPLHSDSHIPPVPRHGRSGDDSDGGSNGGDEANPMAGTLVGTWSVRGGGAEQVVTVSVPAAGTYELAVYFSIADAPPSRSGNVSISGGTTATVTFTGSPKCCGVRTVDYALSDGGDHLVTMTGTTTVLPYIDRIVITRL